MKNDVCHPKRLFSPTGDGVPWEEATGAKGSLSVLAEAKKMRTLWVCSAITSITSLVMLGVTIPLAVAAFHSGAVWVGALVVAFLAPYPLLWLFSLIAPREFMGPDECFYVAKRSHRTIREASASSGYFDFAVPFFEDIGGSTRVIVRDRYGWESSQPHRDTDLDYSGCYYWGFWEVIGKDAPKGWGVHTFLLEPHIRFLNIHEQLELAEHYDDARIRIALAKIVYAGHQIEALDGVALDCVSDVDSPEGQSLLQEYKRCRQWYQVYLQQKDRKSVV